MLMLSWTTVGCVFASKRPVLRSEQQNKSLTGCSAVAVCLHLPIARTLIADLLPAISLFPRLCSPRRVPRPCSPKRSWIRYVR